MLANYHAFLFDMDGTLVQSEQLKSLALADACAHFGPRPAVALYKSVMGQHWAEVTRHFFRHTGIAPDEETFNAVFRQAYLQYLGERLTFTPGAEHFLASLRQQGLPVGLVTSAAGWMVTQILVQLGIDDCFDVVVTKEQVRQHKPHPEAYQTALAQLGLPAAQAVVFEDSSSGVRAGRAAGCDVVAVRHDFNQGHDFSTALAVVEDFGQLDAQR